MKEGDKDYQGQIKFWSEKNLDLMHKSIEMVAILTIIYLLRKPEKLCLRPVFNLTTLLERYTYFIIKHSLGLILRFSFFH